MPDVAQLQVVVTADTTQAERGLSSLGQKVGSVGSTIGTALGGAAVAAVAGLGVAFVGSAKVAADFEKQISAISAVAGPGAASIEELRATALQLGKDTAFSASEAAAGMEEMVKAGVSMADIMGGGARAALDLAAAGSVSVAEAATVASNAMNAFGLAGADMAHIADQLAGASVASATDVHQLGFAFSSVAAVAHQVGLSLEDTTTAISLLAQSGLKGSDAGTSLKAVLNNLVPSTDKASAEMNKLGLNTFDVQNAMALLQSKGIQPVSEDAGALAQQIAQQIIGIKDWATATKKQRDAYDDLTKSSGVLRNAFFDEHGSIKSVAEISQILKEHLGDLTKEQQILALQTLFGTDGQRAASILMKDGAAAVDAMTASIGKLTAQEIANERLNNLWGSVEKLKGSLETAAIMLGSLATPALKVWADQATEWVNMAIDAIEQIPDVIETVKQVLAGDWAPDDSIRGFTLAVGEFILFIKPALTELMAFWTQVFAGDLPAAVQTGVAYLQTVAGILAPIFLEWGAAFVAWVAPMIPPLLAALADLALQLVAWIAAQAPVWLAQLAVWGEQFVAWVAPFIPPLLAALGTALSAMTVWIATTALPALVTGLATWALAFWEWVGPAGALALTELGVVLAAMIVWFANDGLPAIQTELAKWRAAMSQWITDSGPDVVAAMPGLIATILLAMKDLPANVMAIGMEAGKNIVTGMMTGAEGQSSALAEALKSIVVTAVKAALAGLATQIPGLAQLTGNTGGGNPALTNLPAGSSLDQQIAAAAKARGYDPDAIAAYARHETGNYDSKLFKEANNPFSLKGQGPAGSVTMSAWEVVNGKNVMQNETFRKYNSIAEAIDDFLDVVERQYPDVAAMKNDPAAFFRGLQSKGWATDPNWATNVMKGVKPIQIPNATPGGVLGNITMNQGQWGASVGMTPQEAAAACGPYAAALFMQATGRTPNPAEAEQLARLAGWTEGGMGGTGNFMKLLGSMGVRAVQDSTPTQMEAANAAMAQGIAGFSTPEHYFVASGYNPETKQFNVGATGAVTTKYGTGSAWMTYEDIARIGGGIQDVIVLAGQMGSTFTEAGVQVTQALGTTLVSTTDLGNGMSQVVTTVMDAGGQVTAVYTQMVTTMQEQTTTLATTIPAQYANLATSALTSVTDLGTGILTTITDTSGTTIATITNMSGQVTSQIATLSNGVQLDMSAMKEGVLVSVTDLGNGTMTTMQDAAGNIVTTVTDMHGKVTNQYVSMKGEVIGAAQETKTGTEAAINSIQLKEPKVDHIEKALGRIGSAAEKAKKSLDELNEEGEKQDEGPKQKKSSSGKRESDEADFRGFASGGIVYRPETVNVAEREPEAIIPLSQLRDFGPTIDYDEMAAAFKRAGVGASFTLNTQATAPLQYQIESIQAMAGAK